MKTQLFKWGKSVAVGIPGHVAEASRFRLGNVLESAASRYGTVHIRRKKAKPSLAQLVKGITSQNRHAESDWGKPVGNECW